MTTWIIRIATTLIVLTLISALIAGVMVNRSVEAMFGGHTPPAAFGIEDLRTPTPERYVLSGVSVLDPTRERFVGNQAVVIDGGQISSVGPDTEVPSELPRFDGQGRFLVPGYTDSHVHLWNSPNDLLLYLANGVTQVREMHGLAHHLDWREQINHGRLGPDLFVVASQLADYGFWEGLWVEWTSKRNVVGDTEDAADTVRALHAQGFDAIKAGSFVNAENFAVASQLTRELETPLVGHLPVEVELEALWDTHQKELAHVEELVKGLMREFGRVNSRNTDEFLSYVQTRRNDVAQRVAESGITVVSTLALSNRFGDQITDLETTLTDIQLEYVNPGVAEGRAMGWLPGVNRYELPESSRSEGWRERHRIYWQAYAQAHQLMFEELLEHGVPILAGTDASVPVMVPGFSLHQELQAMVDAGMSEAQALESATSAPGDWMAWNTGRVQPGYRANLVLLNENPLEDIRATDSIEQVIINGRILYRDDLDRMLLEVRRANNAARTMDISVY